MAILINAEKRETKKSVNSELRKVRKIPAVIYGKNLKENIHISIEEKEIMKPYQKAEFLYKLAEITLDGKKYPVITKSILLNSVSDRIEHVDFLDVAKDKQVIVDVRVKIVNSEKSMGIKRGGYINFVKRAIKISCPPSEIPAFIEIDIEKLKIGEAVRAKSIELPKNATHVFKPEQTILTVISRGAGKAGEEEAEAADGKK